MNLLAELASEPHKYGMGIIAGALIVYTVNRVMNYLDRNTD